MFAYIARRIYIYIGVNLILCAYVDCMLARCNTYIKVLMYIPFVIFIYIQCLKVPNLPLNFPNITKIIKALNITLFRCN